LSNNPRAPYWDTPTDNAYFGNRRYRLADLVQASMSMPPFFEPKELPVVSGEGKGLFVDASLGIHNNPALFMFLMSVLGYYGLSWSTGPDRLTIASIGTGTFRSAPRFANSLTKHFTLALEGLTSVIQEADAFVLSQMQLMGECPTPWRINSELGTLTGDRPFGAPQFKFLRYDVRLEADWIKSELGMALSQKDILRIRAIDDPSTIPLLYEIGVAAAERQIRLEHWVA
jgi:hypothetical protein